MKNLNTNSTPTPKPAKKKKSESRISVPCTEDLKNRIAKVDELTGIKEATLVRAASEAVCNYVERFKSLTLPLAVIPKHEYEEILLRIGKV